METTWDNLKSKDLQSTVSKNLDSTTKKSKQKTSMDIVTAFFKKLFWIIVIILALLILVDTFANYGKFTGEVIYYLSGGGQY